MERSDSRIAPVEAEVTLESANLNGFHLVVWTPIFLVQLRGAAILANSRAIVERVFYGIYGDPDY